MACLRRRFLPALLAASAALFAGSTARADLVWSPESGWTIDGGALSGLSGSEARNALDLMNTARRLEERAHYHTAGNYYRRVADRYPNSIYSSEALYRSGYNYLLKKEYYKAFDAYQRTLAFYPNTPRFSEIVGEQYRIASALLDGARNRMFRGTIPGFKNPERALGYFESIIATAPFGDYAPLALMNVAQAHLRYDNVEEAIDAFNRMINTYPNNLLTPDAYLKLGQTFADLVDGPEYDQASTREAITYLTDFILRFPNDPGVPEAERTLARMRSSLAQSKIKMGDYYLKTAKYTAARVFYNEAITAYPGSEDEKVARSRLVEVEAKLGNAPGPINVGTPQPEKRRKRFLFF